MLLEEVLDHNLHVHPLVLVELVGEKVLILLFIQVVGAKHLEKYFVKLLLNASHCEVGVVFGFVNGVEWGTAIEEVLALLVVPESNVPHPEHTLAEEDQIVNRNVLVQMRLIIKLRRLCFLMDCKENPRHSHQ